MKKRILRTFGCVNRGDYRVVIFQGFELAKFHVVADDYAFTHANEYIAELRKLTDDELMRKFPEIFI